MYNDPILGKQGLRDEAFCKEADSSGDAAAAKRKAQRKALAAIDMALPP